MQTMLSIQKTRIVVVEFQSNHKTTLIAYPTNTSPEDVECFYDHLKYVMENFLDIIS